MKMDHHHHHHHFLLVTFAAQGHINPAHQLARQLVRIAGARVTISTGLSAHRKLFRTGDRVQDDDERLITYCPYSDDDAAKPKTTDNFFTRLKLIGSESLSLVISSLATTGRPVTCIIYTILLSWAVDVGRTFGIPSVPFWVQPATVFAVFHRYFHGASDLISARADDHSFSLDLPGIPPLRMEDLPSFLVQDAVNGTASSAVVDAFEEMFRTIDRHEPMMVLVNTFDSLEPSVLASAVDSLKLVAVGPTVGGSRLRRDLFDDDDSGGYMEWLDSKEDKSVVYVSFGSIATLSKEQTEEIRRGLEEGGRPYLWVVRRDAKEKGCTVDEVAGGLVVEWCDQVGVLSHRSVGCFVTHCGWNSTMEGLSCGVPMVMLPQWADQPTNARLVEGAWGNGVRMRASEAGTATAAEFVRCLDLVMGEGGAEVRSRAAMWREKAREAREEGCGSSDRNLKAFAEAIGSLADPVGEWKTGANVGDPIMGIGVSVT